MTMTTRDAFERGTDTFNAHDLDGFAEVLADDVVFQAPGGMRGQGKRACVEFYGGWLSAFPDGHVEIHDVHVIDDLAAEEGTFSGTHEGVLHTPSGDVPPTGRAVSRTPGASMVAIEIELTLSRSGISVAGSAQRCPGLSTTRPQHGPGYRESAT